MAKIQDTQIQKIKKQYLDSRKSNMNRINSELQEVHKIMAQNIEDVLQRGDALTSKQTNKNSVTYHK